jgi:hypothetical protein
VNPSKSALAALALSVVFAVPSAAQDSTVIGAPAYPAACVEQIAEYMGCLNYRDLPEAQARTARGHPEFVEAPSQTESRPSAMVSRAAEAPSARPVARQ